MTKIGIEGGSVAVVEDSGPAGDGRPRVTTRTMTLEQYAKHARDAEFAKDAPALERSAVLVAIAAKA